MEYIQPRQLFIITGMSGAGKSTALRVFEDQQYFAVDGLPINVCPEVAAIMEREPMRHYPGMAMGLDLRQSDFLKEFNSSLERLERLNLVIKIIFLDADDKTLIRRYASTRRPHPLEINGMGLENAIVKERELLRPLREKADIVIDSSECSIHELRRTLLRRVLHQDGSKHSLRVNVISFGFKYGIPNDSDMVFDLRFLDNPYFIDTLRPLSGKDKPVVEYIFGNRISVELRQKILDLLFFALEQMEIEGRYRLTIAFGCTGGRHRSVAMAEEIAQTLRQTGYTVIVQHRHLEEDVK